MSVNLFDYVEYVKGMVNPPGGNLFPDSTDEQWVVRLANGFWESHADGLLTGYTEDNGIITATTGDDPLARDKAQVVVLYAAISAVRSKLMEYNTNFRAVAGPVQYEIGKSANLLTAVLADLTNRKKYLLEKMDEAESKTSRSTYYIDTIMARDYSINSGATRWVGYGY